MKNKLILMGIIALALFLRVYKLGEFPPGLYSDETAYGYNAYALLKTGHDEYGKFWPLTFQSFGDYKPPMTAWLTIPSIAIFGLNEFAVRLPSALAGTLTVLIVYFLAKETFPNVKFSILNLQFSIGELASSLLAISPWHLHFSRASMLVSIEVMFISLSLLLFLKALKKPWLLPLSAISFAAAIYTYYGSRLTVPLLLLMLLVLFGRRIWQMRPQVIASVILGSIIISPLVVATLKDPATITGRARTISIFYSPGVRAQLWQAHTDDGPQYPTFWGRVFHNKPYYYFKEIARRYFQHLSYDFWVKTGDTTPPFDIPNMGVVYLLDIIPVGYGAYLAFRYRSKKSLVLLGYFFISPVVASLTFITPAANRAFNMVVGWNILTALGLVALTLKIHHKFRYFGYWLLVIGYCVSFGYYLYQYYVSTPQQIAYKWHYGRRELIEKVTKLEGNYQHIIFSNKEGPAYIWLLFYKSYSPQSYWQTMVVDKNLDELGWMHIAGFDKYVFPRQFDWGSIDKKLHTLYIGYEDQIPEGWAGESGGKKLKAATVDKVIYPNGKTAFTLVQLQPQ